MASKKDYGIEEHLYEMLLDLYRLECSNIFRQPVDIKLSKCPDYYHVIKDPMDLSTLKANYKDRMYHRISDIKTELEKIIQNCRFFNKKGHPILKICDKFESCYQTRWKTLDALRKSMNIPDDYELNVKVDNLDMIDQRKHKKKEPALLQAAIKKSEPPKQEFNYAFKITSKSLFPFEDPKDAVIPTYIDYEDKPVEAKIIELPQKTDSPEKKFKIKLEAKQEKNAVEMSQIKVEEGPPLTQMESIQKLLSQLPQPQQQAQIQGFNFLKSQIQSESQTTAQFQQPLQYKQSQQQQQSEQPQKDQQQELKSVFNPSIPNKLASSPISYQVLMPQAQQPQPQVQQYVTQPQMTSPFTTLLAKQQQMNSTSEKIHPPPINLPVSTVVHAPSNQLDNTQAKQFSVQLSSNTPQKSIQIQEVAKIQSSTTQPYNIKQLLSRMPPPQSDQISLIKIEQQQQQQQQSSQIQVETPKKAFEQKIELKVENGNGVQILSTPKLKNKKTIDSDDENYLEIPIQRKNESEKKREAYILKIDPIQVKQHSEEYKQRKEEKLNKFFMKLFSQIKKCLTQHKRQSAALDLILNGIDFPDLGRVNMVLEWMRYDVSKIPFIEQQHIYRYLGLCIRICYRLKQTQNDLSEEFVRLLNKEQEELKMQQRQAALQQQKIEKIEQRMDIVEFDYKLLSKQIKIKQLQKINFEKHNQQKQQEIKIESFGINFPKLQKQEIKCQIDSESEEIDQQNQTFQVVDQSFMSENKNFSFLKILDAITINSKFSLGNKENGLFPQISVEKMQFFILNKNSHFVQSNKSFIQQQFDQLKYKYDQKSKDIQFNNISSKNYYIDEKNHQLFEIYQIDNYVEILLKLRYQDHEQFQCDVMKFAIDFEIQNILSFRTGYNFINYNEINKEYQLRLLQLPQSISEQIINSSQFQINSIFVDSLSDLQMNKKTYCGVQLGTPFIQEDYQFYIQLQIPFTSIQDLILKLNEQIIFPIQS